MRVPLQWLRDYVDVALSAEELADVLTLGGFEVEGIERPTAGARGVRVVEVADVAPIEGSDKLSLVHATDGEESWEIVCGASNFSPGDKVPAALPGAVLPGGFEIGRKKLFGVVSNGMLASKRELAVGEDHSGIWVLDDDAPLGADLGEWLGLDDPVLVLDVTPDRGYGLSLHGLARDVAALTGSEVRIPEGRPPSGDPEVPVTISAPDRCARFDGRVIRGVTSRPSPAWMQVRLAAAGIRPLSAVVDVTNYVLLETGNPTHAYDLDLLAGPAIDVRTARQGESMTTLDGTDRRLDPDDLLICDADGPVALAGVMGGERTEINDATTNVFLEVANFTARTVLRTARRHGLHTEGSRRWERVVPAETVPLAATRCVELVLATTGGVEGGGSDTYPTPVVRPVIRLRPARAREYLGIDEDDEGQVRLLESIDCAVEVDEEGLRVTPPAGRPDLTEPVDLYEELARLYGYDRVPSRMPSTGQVGGRSPEQESRQTVRRALAGGGWTEVMPFPFIAHEDVEALGLPDGDARLAPVALENPLSKEEAVLRTTMLPGLLKVLRRNVNRQLPDVAVFEIGHVFMRPTTELPGAWGGPGGRVLPAEPQALGLAACGAFVPGRHDRDARQVDLYDLLGAVELIRLALGRDAFEVTATDEAPFHPGRAARLVVDGEVLGVVGELHPRVIAAFDIPPRTLAGELRMDPLLAGGPRPREAVVPSPYPAVRFDVAVVVDESVRQSDVQAAVRAGAGPALADCTLFDLYRGPSIGDGRKSLAYRIRLEDPARQLSDEDEAAAIEGIAVSVEQRVGGTLRR